MNTKSVKTILVIEDEQMMVKVLRGKLEKAGFNVLAAEDGERGFQKALENHPDLILLDIILPVMDGITVLEKIRADSWGQSVPIIVLSNLSRVATIDESKEMGVRAYLVKTNWKLNEVIEKVKYELGIE
jgi:DNA-binding response OmpR family regulator